MEMGIETELQTGNRNGDGATDSLRMEAELQTETSALLYWATILQSFPVILLSCK